MEAVAAPNKTDASNFLVDEDLLLPLTVSATATQHPSETFQMTRKTWFIDCLCMKFP